MTRILSLPQAHPFAGVDHKLFAIPLLLLGGVCLGVSPVVVKAIDLPPVVSAFYRVALSAPIFGLWALFTPKSQVAPISAERSSGILCALAACFFSADLAVMHYAVTVTNVAIATLFTNCAPFFVGALGVIGLADKPKARFWPALVIAFVGIALLIGVSRVAENGSTAGDLLALTAAGLYSGYLVCVRHLRSRGIRSISIMAIVTSGSAALLAPIFIASGTPAPSSYQTVALLSLLVLVGQVAGQGLVTLALLQLPVAMGSMILLIQPVVAAALSWVFLSEELSASQAMGMMIVLFSIGYAVWPEKPAKKTKPLSARATKNANASLSDPRRNYPDCD